MITVQAAGCAPIVKAWEAGKSSSEMWPDAATFALDCGCRRRMAII